MKSMLNARAKRHYFDSLFQCQAVKVLPNQYYVTDEALMITTVLGSCIAACIRDPVNGIGGMNHFMLPEGDIHSPKSASMRYGTYAMEVLINEVVKAGGIRERLEAKVFGGGAVVRAMQQMNVGERNRQFVLAYLEGANIPLRAQDLGDVHGRRINYFPRDGRVLVRRLLRQQEQVLVARREAAISRTLNTQARALPRPEPVTRPGPPFNPKN